MSVGRRTRNPEPSVSVIEQLRNTARAKLFPSNAGSTETSSESPGPSFLPPRIELVRESYTRIAVRNVTIWPPKVAAPAAVGRPITGTNAAAPPAPSTRRRDSKRDMAHLRAERLRRALTAPAAAPPPPAPSTRAIERPSGGRQRIARGACRSLPTSRASGVVAERSAMQGSNRPTDGAVRRVRTRCGGWRDRPTPVSAADRRPARGRDSRRGP